MRSFKNDLVPKVSAEIFHNISDFLKIGTHFNLEIGCGVGLHPIQYAMTHLYEKTIAIERTQEKFTKFKTRFINHKSPSNLLPVHADAISIVTHALPNNLIQKIFILYPNPEPKNKNQRWINMPFFSELRRVLNDTGQIEIRTNVEGYAQEIKQQCSRQKMKLEIFRILDKSEFPKTHFEKKYLLRDEKCFELVLKKDIKS
jgi:tRNA (guanine-N7-)-methyltransferase